MCMGIMGMGMCMVLVTIIVLYIIFYELYFYAIRLLYYP